MCWRWRKEPGSGFILLALNWQLDGKKQQVPPLRFASVGMTNLFGCWVGDSETNLSSRPERTRISCHAALTNIHVCGFPLKKAA
jgi:hypothetical protein